jgi:hypothetical protein
MGFALRSGKASKQGSLFGAKPTGTVANTLKRVKAMKGRVLSSKPFDAQKHPRDSNGRWKYSTGGKRFTLSGKPAPRPKVAPEKPPAERTPYLLDMKRGDLPGQTTIMERFGTIQVGRDATARIAQGRGTPERLKRANEIATERAAGNWGSASRLLTKNKPLGYEKRQIETLTARLKRSSKNTELVRGFLASGGHAGIGSYTKPMLVTHPENILPPSPTTAEMRVITGYKRDKTPIITSIARGDQERGFTRPARLARAQELRAQRAATPAPSLREIAAKSPFSQALAKARADRETARKRLLSRTSGLAQPGSYDRKFYRKTAAEYETDQVGAAAAAAAFRASRNDTTPRMARHDEAIQKAIIAAPQLIPTRVLRDYHKQTGDNAALNEITDRMQRISAKRAAKPAQVKATATPAPSLREIAAKHRAAKGTTASRLALIANKSSAIASKRESAYNSAISRGDGIASARSRLNVASNRTQKVRQAMEAASRKNTQDAARAKLRKDDPASDIVARQSTDTRKEIARGNAVSLLASLVPGMSPKFAAAELADLRPLRVTTQRYKASGRTGYEKPTSGVHQASEMIDIATVYERAARALRARSRK